MSDLYERLRCPSEKVERTKPVNLGCKDESLFELTRYLSEARLFQAKNALIFPSGYLLDGLVLNPNQYMALSPRGIVSSHLRSALSLLRVRHITRVNRVFFVTNDLSSRNFFHWFLDVVQKLEFIDEHLTESERQDYQIIIPANHRSEFIRASLPAFKFNFLEQARHELVLAENAIFVPYLAPSGSYRRGIISRLSDRLRKYFLTSGEKSPLKVYITRQSAAQRRVLNEGEIIPILQKYGFVILNMDRISFLEQVEYIQNAEVLISIHGAGLTHMLWMNQPGKVLEIRARGDAHNNCYFSLASDLSLDYFYTFADKVDSRKTVQESDYSNPI